MFCPKCATKNLEGASFCRTCGANISLVPQAMTGQMMQQQPAEVTDEACSWRKPGSKKLTLDQSFKNIFMGVAFLIIAIALSRTIGAGWWFWMLLPAFSLMGTGIAQYIRVRESAKQELLAPRPMARAFAEPVRSADELRGPVASVTEGTTRHLNATERK